MLIVNVFQAELQQRHLASPGNSDNLRDDDVEDESEYPDVTGQCESTEADQYKMNPEADQSETGGGDTDIFRHAEYQDVSDSDDMEEDGEVEGQLAVKYSSEEGEEREGDGSRGLTEDDQAFAVGGGQGSANRNADGWNEGGVWPTNRNADNRVNRNSDNRANRNADNRANMTADNWMNRNVDNRANRNADGRGGGRSTSPDWTSRNAEADGSGHEPMLSSIGSTNRSTPADGSGSGESPTAVTRNPRNDNVVNAHQSASIAYQGASNTHQGVVHRFAMNQQHVANPNPNARDDNSSSIGQRPMTASGSDDEAFLCRQRLAPRSPLHQHPRSAFVQPVHSTEAAAGSFTGHGVGVGGEVELMEHSAGVGGEGGFEHSGGVGQEADEPELHLLNVAAGGRTGNAGPDKFNFKPIAAAGMISKHGSGEARGDKGSVGNRQTSRDIGPRVKVGSKPEIDSSRTALGGNAQKIQNTAKSSAAASVSRNSVQGNDTLERGGRLGPHGISSDGKKSAGNSAKVSMSKFPRATGVGERGNAKGAVVGGECGNRGLANASNSHGSVLNSHASASNNHASTSNNHRSSEALASRTEGSSFDFPAESINRIRRSSRTPPPFMDLEDYNGLDRLSPTVNPDSQSADLRSIDLRFVDGVSKLSAKDLALISSNHSNKSKGSSGMSGDSHSSMSGIATTSRGHENENTETRRLPARDVESGGVGRSSGGMAAVGGSGGGLPKPKIYGGGGMSQVDISDGEQTLRGLQRHRQPQRIGHDTFGWEPVEPDINNMVSDVFFQFPSFFSLDECVDSK